MKSDAASQTYLDLQCKKHYERDNNTPVPSLIGLSVNNILYDTSLFYLEVEIVKT